MFLMRLQGVGVAGLAQIALALLPLALVATAHCCWLPGRDLLLLRRRSAGRLIRCGLLTCAIE